MRCFWKKLNWQSAPRNASNISGYFLWAGLLYPGSTVITTDSRSSGNKIRRVSYRARWWLLRWNSFGCQACAEFPCGHLLPLPSRPDTQSSSFRRVQRVPQESVRVQGCKLCQGTGPWVWVVGQWHTKDFHCWRWDVSCRSGRRANGIPKPSYKYWSKFR